MPGVFYRKWLQHWIYSPYAGNAGAFYKRGRCLSHSKTDEICSACPNNSQGICEAAEKVKRYDNAVLAECGLKEGQKLAFPEFTEAVQKKIIETGKERKSAAIASGTGSARNSRVGGVNKAALAEKYREPDIQHFAESGSLCFKDYLFDFSFLLSPRFLRIWL